MSDAETPKVPTLITLAELSTRVQRSRRTVHTWLKERGIKPMGHSVFLVDIQDRWPMLYRALVLAASPKPACPSCGAGMGCECPACGFTRN